MAKENTVILYGLAKKCDVRYDENFEKPLSGKIVMETVRRTYATSERIMGGASRFDSPIVYSRNIPVIKYGIEQVRAGDLIEVKGTLVTQDTKRKFRCPDCGAVTFKDFAVTVYVDPIFVRVIQEGYDENTGKGLTEEEVRVKMQKHYEIGNLVWIIGTLCREPKPFYRDPVTGYDKFEFQIASERLRHIREDDPEKKVDFPWVYCYGKNCEEYSNKLHKGSTVFIHGAIETRKDKIVHKCRCSNCGKLLERPGIATEIVPYNVEYLNKCGDFESIDYETFDEEDPRNAKPF